MSKQYLVHKGSVMVGSTQYKQSQVIIETPKNQGAISLLLKLKNPPIKELTANVPSEKPSEK